MPSPLGHGLAGLTVLVLTARPGLGWSPRRASLVVAAALGADLDFALRLLDGRNHHQTFTHSFGFAAVVGCATYVITRAAGSAEAVRLALAVAAAWSTHVILDFLGEDTSDPVGVLALWPFDRRHFHFPWPVFMDIRRSPELSVLVHDLKAALREAVLLGPLLAAAWYARARRWEPPWHEGSRASR